MAIPLSVVLAAVLLAQATTAADPDAAGGPSTPTPAQRAAGTVPASLREIGRVKAVTTFCKGVWQHATVAVQSALDNDAALVQDEQWLQSVDLDSTILLKQQGVQSLTNRYVRLRASAKTGEAEANAIRKAAADAPTPEQKQYLTDFANALAGALKRQKLLADDIGRFIAYLDSHEPITQEQHDQMVFEATLRGPEFNNVHHSQDPRDSVPPMLSDVAKTAGSELALRQQPVYEDESRAAEKIEPGFKACE